MAVQERILVLEDDEVLLGLISETLSDEGYFVADAPTPERAVEIAERDQFHLLVTDVRMAGFADGLGVLEILKRRRPHLRSIVITGYTDLASPAKAMRLQADDYLFKGDTGFGMKRLLETVRRVLDHRPASQGLVSRLLARSGGLLKLPYQALLNARLPQLESARAGLFKVFYIGISSGHLSVEQGQPCWRHLLFLERDYLNLQDLKTLTQLAESYAGLSAHLIDGSPPPQSMLEEGDLPFRRVHEAVRNKRLPLDSFQALPRLVLQPQSRKDSVHHFALFESLGVAEPEPDLVGLTFGPYRVVKPLGRQGERRVYRAAQVESGQLRQLELVPRAVFQAEALLQSLPASSPLRDLEWSQATDEGGAAGASRGRAKTRV